MIYEIWASKQRQISVSSEFDQPTSLSLAASLRLPERMQVNSFLVLTSVKMHNEIVPS
jgi:hypothetical protein